MPFFICRTDAGTHTHTHTSRRERNNLKKVLTVVHGCSKFTCLKQFAREGNVKLEGAEVEQAGCSSS